VRTRVDADAHIVESRVARMDPRAQIAVVFVSHRTSEHDDDYAEMADRMEHLAREQPGFVDIVSVRDPVSRIGITVAYFEDEASVLAWKRHPEHREAQRRGVADFYEQYSVTVAEVQRHYAFPAAPGIPWTNGAGHERVAEVQQGPVIVTED
jgi:heme-degrading monooxygenase HmoA